MYIRPDQVNWDEMLPKVASAYNNSVHLATCRTPNELHKSFTPRRPFEGLNRDQIQRLPPGTREFALQHEKELATIVENLRKAQHRMIEQANKHRRPSQFQVGDLVWVKSKEFAPEENISQKLLPAYRGPWPVLEVKGGEDGPSYTVEIPAHLHTYPVFHASKLLPCITSQQFPSRRPMIPPDMDGRYDIDGIVGEDVFRTGGRGRPQKQYKVRFAYQEPEDDRWFTRTELLESAPDVRFAGVVICSLRPDDVGPWKVILMPCTFVADDWSAAGNSAQPTRIFKLKVTERTRLFAGLHQESPQMLGAPEPFKVGIWIVDKQNRYLATRQSQDTTCEVDAILGPGLYHIMVKAFSFTSRNGEVCKFPDVDNTILPRRFVLTIHSEAAVRAKLASAPPTKPYQDEAREAVFPSDPVSDIPPLSVLEQRGQEETPTEIPLEVAMPVLYSSGVTVAGAARAAVAESTVEPPQQVSVKVVRYPVANSVMVPPRARVFDEFGQEIKEEEPTPLAVYPSLVHPVPDDEVEDAIMMAGSTYSAFTEHHGVPTPEPQQDLRRTDPVDEPEGPSLESEGAADVVMSKQATVGVRELPLSTVAEKLPVEDGLGTLESADVRQGPAPPQIDVVAPRTPVEDRPETSARAALKHVPVSKKADAVPTRIPEEDRPETSARGALRARQLPMPLPVLSPEITPELEAPSQREELEDDDLHEEHPIPLVSESSMVVVPEVGQSPAAWRQPDLDDMESTTPQGSTTEEIFARSLGIPPEDLPDLWKSAPWQAVETVVPSKGVESYGPISDPQYQPHRVSWHHGVKLIPAGKFIPQPRLFSSKLDPANIEQGLLGNLWFLSAVATLLEFPALVLKVFMQKELSPDGIYRLRFFKSGRLVQVAVDTKIPCKDYRPIYAHSTANELWVMLIEKAYAKLHGSYEALSGGSPSEAIQDLTGAPCVTFVFSSQKFLRFESTGGFWPLLKGYCDRGFILTVIAAGPDECAENQVKREGPLVNGHAFAVLEVHKALGMHLMTGPRPSSTKPWKDLRMPCSFIADDWSAAGNTKQPSRMFRLKVPEPTRIVVTIDQEDTQSLQALHPLKTGVWIIDKQTQILAVSQSFEPLCQVELTLQPGIYRVLTKAFAYRSGTGIYKFPDRRGAILPRQFTLSVLADRPVDVFLMTVKWVEANAGPASCPTSFLLRLSASDLGNYVPVSALRLETNHCMLRGLKWFNKTNGLARGAESIDAGTAVANSMIYVNSYP
ncbi:hypothetical protein CBR_g38075 [Chara braunii]|uniref:Calpain catalytic domain-containing protein n=1 Tax=Chara braunii TaxID=69332 RepID=A0A388K0B6_CHABU|nr:hypothetical protein CBR_g38075 [Chara braunii]|eukprot:GBG63456.1 hypothetical protein CBR_g38075 [Chara braunii]